MLTPSRTPGRPSPPLGRVIPRGALLGQEVWTRPVTRIVSALVVCTNATGASHALFSAQTPCHSQARSFFVTLSLSLFFGLRGPASSDGRLRSWKSRIFVHCALKSAVISRSFGHHEPKNAVISRNFVHHALKAAVISRIFVHSALRNPAGLNMLEFGIQGFLVCPVRYS